MKHLIFPIMLSLIPISALAEPIDLNVASAQEIAETLDGIGRSKAQKII